tara:strand:- start:1147 stop:1296 length:150 start_codon:yes stop_codon:yes gene_type:complete
MDFSISILIVKISLILRLTNKDNQNVTIDYMPNRFFIVISIACPSLKGV